MVKITNGVKTFEVTNGAYLGVFKKQGYTIVGSEKPVAAEPIVSKTGDELFAEEIREKPISQWNKEEVKRFATIAGVDISGTKNVNEAKERIKAFLDNSVEVTDEEPKED